jgi:hypothetical protein
VSHNRHRESASDDEPSTGCHSLKLWGVASSPGYWPSVFGQTIWRVEKVRLPEVRDQHANGDFQLYLRLALCNSPANGLHGSRLSHRMRGALSAEE